MSCTAGFLARSLLLHDTHLYGNRCNRKSRFSWWDWLLFLGLLPIECPGVSNVR